MPAVAPPLALPNMPSTVGASVPAGGCARAAKGGQPSGAVDGAFDALLIQAGNDDCNVAPARELPVAAEDNPLVDLAGCAVCTLPPTLELNITLDPDAAPTDAVAGDRPILAEGIAAPRPPTLSPTLLGLLQKDGAAHDAADQDTAPPPCPDDPRVEPVATPAPVLDAGVVLTEEVAPDAEQVAQVASPLPEAGPQRPAKADKAAPRALQRIDADLTLSEPVSSTAAASPKAVPPPADASASPPPVVRGEAGKPAIDEAPSKAAEPIASIAASATGGANPSVDAGAATSVGHATITRASAETTAQLAAQIVRKLEGQHTRFDVSLTPEGLGRVEVAVRIAQDGALSAAFNFDQPQSAADVGARAGELRQALQQAGFEVPREALSFTSGDDRRSGGSPHQQDSGRRNAPQNTGFDAFLNGEPDPFAALPSSARSLRLGLDVRV